MKLHILTDPKTLSTWKKDGFISERMAEKMSDCETEGHVWEVGPDGKCTKCTFCGKPAEVLDEQQLDLEHDALAKVCP